MNAPCPLATVSVELETRAETNKHEHWRARSERSAEANAVVFDALALVADRIDPRPGLLVRLTRVVGDKREQLDDDNTVGALKHCRDAVARWLGVDDRDPCVTWCTAELFVPGPLRVRVELFRRGAIADEVPGVALLDAGTLLAVAEVAAIAARAGASDHTMSALRRAGLLPRDCT